MSTKHLREQRAKLVAEARDLSERATKDGRPLSSEESARWDTIFRDIDALKVQIDQVERLEGEERLLSEPITPFKGHGNGGSSDQAETTEAVEMDAFRSYVRNGISGMSPEHRAAAQKAQLSLPSEMRAQAQGTGSAGGYLVPQAFSNRITEFMKYYGPMIAISDTIDTENGADLPWPSVDDTGQTGAILAENTQIAGQDITFSSVTLKGYMYTSKLVLVSFQLLQDSYFDLDTNLARWLGIRLGRILNTHFTTGTGSSQPNGVITASSVGKTAAGTNAVTFDEIIDTMHSVDVAYRNNGKFMAHDLIIAAVRKLKDTTNQYLWQPGVKDGQPDTILGHPVVTNNDMASTLATGNRVMLFGDFSGYKIRRVAGTGLLRLVERYADYLQVGFFAFGRYDGNLSDTTAVKQYRLA